MNKFKDELLLLGTVFVILIVCIYCRENPETTVHESSFNDSIENVLPYPYGNILKDVVSRDGTTEKQIKIKNSEQDRIYVDGKAWLVTNDENRHEVTIKRHVNGYITIKKSGDTFVVNDNYDGKYFRQSYNDHYIYSSDGEFIKDLILEKELGLDVLPQDPYRDILKDLFLNYLGCDIKEFKVSKNSMKLKYIKNGDDFISSTKYYVSKKGENGLVMEFNDTRPIPEKITINKADSLYVVTLSYHDVVWEDRDYRDVYTKKEFVYDEECNMVSLARQIKGREDSMERQLLNITSIKDEDKRIIAAILSSKGILRLEFIESRDCLEAFGSNEDAAYRFLFCPTENKNGYLGFMVKMDKDAALQSDIRNSSSHIYAVKVLDKSTNDTKRMLVSIVQVIQEDLMSSNYKAKYGGKSSNTSTKGESKTDVHGKRTNLGIIMGINGELLNSYNESSFTKEYMNDVCEEFEYTYTGGVLKLNDTPPYDMTKYRL